MISPMNFTKNIIEDPSRKRGIIKKMFFSLFYESSTTLILKLITKMKQICHRLALPMNSETKVTPGETSEVL